MKQDHEDDVTSHFDLDETVIYLNHAAVSPWPRATREAVCRFADENARLGATHYPKWLVTEERLRGQLATLINAPSPADIALVKNTSEALSFVAQGLDWRPGDNLVLLGQEFPSNRIPWQALAARGVEARMLDVPANEEPEEWMLNAVDERTRLITVSSVQYATGLRMDLERLGRFCREHGILFCVDAIQSLGALPFDAQACGADFVMADGHKWMLGPEGLALFYVRPEIRERLTLTQYGWHMVEQEGGFDSREWSPAKSARRFECGTPNMLGIHALTASLELLQRTGIPEISRMVIKNTRYLIELIDESNGSLELVSDPAEDRLSGIVSFRVRGRESNGVHRELMEKGVICACRGDAIRFSPHFYTPREQLEKGIALAASLVG